MTCAIASRAEEIFLSEKETQILRQRILLLLLNAVKQGYTNFKILPAWGVPLWSAEWLCILKKQNPSLKLSLILPHERQAEKWEYSQKKRFYRVLDLADVVVSASVSSDKESFMKAYRMMLNFSDLLLLYGKQGFLNYQDNTQESFVEMYADERQIPIRYI